MEENIVAGFEWGLQSIGHERFGVRRGGISGGRLTQTCADLLNCVENPLVAVEMTLRGSGEQTPCTAN
ncbi:hypothetical protein P3T76_001697 [Phytophthora citrophthora]|uniref:Uncharacterized protein n=1 Tax=Phytophthora citrophthora TaxID=4793 RepID=A0AAD9GZL9_9STRA|nr:hypothetical protein P3T76_001697 [Phytophthora citrophthora]